MVMHLQQVHEYIYVSTTYCYAVIGRVPASREDVLVVCLASVHTTRYTLVLP